MAPTLAEVKLVQLKNCLVNVPQSIVTVLDNARAVNSLRISTFRTLLTRSGRPKCRCRITV